MPNLPVVAIFGAKDINLKTLGPVPHFETQELECHCFETDVNLQHILVEKRPVSIISFGDINNFPNILNSPFDIRRRWIHFPKDADINWVGQAAYNSFIYDVAISRPSPPLVTVFTPAYKTGGKIFRPYNSLLSQTYSDWEWILWDDSDDDGETFKMLSNLSKNDHRIGVFKSHRHSGVIGEVKRWAAMIGRGKYIIELDHDDELSANCISDIVSAFEKHPEAGFAYTDCAEVFENGENRVYPDGWAFGYGSKYDLNYRGKNLNPLRAPLPNPKTVRHIVSSPNHARAWRRDFYESIGGHSRLMHVADDYELCVRTFLNTKMIQIRRMGYIQYYNASGNTQFTRNKDIQRLVRSIKELYDERIHTRFVSLGIEDYIWNEESKSSNLYIPNCDVEKHAGIIFE